MVEAVGFVWARVTPFARLEQDGDGGRELDTIPGHHFDRHLAPVATQVQHLQNLFAILQADISGASGAQKLAAT